MAGETGLTVKRSTVPAGGGVVALRVSARQVCQDARTCAPYQWVWLFWSGPEERP